MDTLKLEIIYKMLINRIQLTDQTLNTYGFNQEEITQLISSKIIEPLSDGSYKLYQVDKMRKYGVLLLQQGKIYTADKCFNICYELAPHGKSICLQAMISAINKKDYQKVFEIYSNLEKIHPKKNAPNNYLYLYLLSVITNVPEEYIRKSKDIKPSDYILPSSSATKIENEIRIAISQNKFTYACQLINERMIKEKDYSVKFELLQTLTNKAADWNKRFKGKIFHLIQSENYEQIVSIILEQPRHLSDLETNILLIADAIVNILKNKNIPNPTIESTDNIQEAIRGNNFSLAHEINKSYLESNNLNKERNLIHILLTKINTLIESYQKNQELSELEETAYFISSRNMSIKESIKKYGLLYEQTLLVKLIYARDYYKASDYEKGDKYLQEVEQDTRRTLRVTIFLEEIKANRNEYAKEGLKHTKQLTQNN